MTNIQIRPYYRKYPVVDLLTVAAETTLQMEGKTGNLTIVLTGDNEIRELNRSFRKVDAATDVLSFPSEELDPETGLPYFGDIILSYPHARKQAATEHHSAADELTLLVVHGVLHLLKYDHSTREERTKMWKKQAEILTALRISMNSFTSLET